MSYCYSFFFLSFFFFNFFLFVVNFVIHWNETSMGLHVFPLPIPPPTSLSTHSPQVFPVHQVRALPSHTPTMLMGAFNCLQSYLHAENSKNIPGAYNPTGNIYSVQKTVFPCVSPSSVSNQYNKSAQVKLIQLSYVRREVQLILKSSVCIFSILNIVFLQPKGRVLCSRIECRALLLLLGKNGAPL